MSSIEMCHSNKPHSSFDFEGLEESLVDNNEDDDDEDFIDPGLADSSVVGLVPDPSGSGIIFDHNLYLIRDALIRDSANRTEEDIEIIVRFLSIINSNHDHMTRKRLAPHFVLAEIEARDTRVLTHGEKLDAYCIVAAGSLRHVLPCEDEALIQETLGSSVDDDNYMTNLPSHTSESCTAAHHVRYLHVGDEFGSHLDDRVVYGEIFTNEDFVWVLCVPHLIFDQICGEKTFKTIRDEVTGNIIEMRANCLLPTPVEGSTVASVTTVSVEPPLASTECVITSMCPPGKHFPDEESFKASNKVAAPNSLPLKATDSNELIRATKDRLYELVLNSEPNETFIEDFLLTFRIWSEKDLQSGNKDSKIMANLMNRICHNIRNNIHVENCVRIVLIWLVNHFQDFQNENRYRLDEFECVLKENSSYKSQLRLFYMNLSAKSVERQVTVTRSDRNSTLPFSLIGGYECSARLFIGEILQTSSSSSTGSVTLDLRAGDRVISINGVDCHVMPIGRAYDLCRSSTHLSLQVKFDPHLFYALIEGRHETKRQIVETFPLTNRLSSSSSSSGFGSSSTLTSGNSSSSANISKESKNSTGNIWKQKVRSFVSTTNHLISSTSNILNNNSNSSSHNSNQLNNSLSSSSISSISASSPSSIYPTSSSSSSFSHPRILSYEIPEIIKIYLFENNDCKFLPIHSSTTARECIQLALREFQLQSNYSSRDFALYEYSVIFNHNSTTTTSTTLADDSSAAAASSTMVKRLSDGTSDLVHNLGLNSRLYLKNVTQPSSGNSLSDADISKEIIKDSSINSLLTLDGTAIARELTARDFRLFCKIEAQQFVYDLAYNDSNNSSSSASNSVLFERTRELQDFERKTNEEMFWTINQVLGEKKSLTKRVKAIKQLIRIATLAMKLNNYNTLFAILSGLMHLSVSRLKSCWDRVPAKHQKQLQKLQQLMDPSRNFYNFRQQLMQKLRQDNGASIIIPFFPLVKKDLSFIWLANQTYVNSTEPPASGDTLTKTEMLVNWEKMRLLSEKIREIQKMTNTTSLAVAAVNGLKCNNSNGPGLPATSLDNEPIDPNLLFRMFADATTSEDPRTFSHKRLWESQRMSKRVQSFLDETFSSITSDEHILLSRSHSCELPQTPNSSHPTTRSSIASTMSSNSQLSHPSPTPSTASSSSNSLSMHSDGLPGQLVYRPHRPKFGQTSPKQLRKLLALSDGAVIVPHHHGNSANNSNSNSGTHGSNPSHHYHHHHSHQSQQQQQPPPSQHQQQYSSHSTRASNSSLNSNLSNSASYYNSIYGCHPHHSYPNMLNSYGTNGGNYGPAASHSKMSYLNHNSSTYSSSCCTMSNCCGGGVPPNGPLYPNQSYCSCCNSGNNNNSSSSLMRPSLLMMPPPQTSGLMQPACPCGAPVSSQPPPSGRRPSLPAKQPLPVESSSVTSLRRLEQYQQMTRHREMRQQVNSKPAAPSSSRRPQCPDYDTTMQRICGGNSLNGGTLPSTTNNNGLKSSRSQHREDIV